jgi:hypothetical protein
MVAAAACLTAAALAVTQPILDLPPRDTAATIEHALELERSGHSTQAEVLMLEAARLDHQYQPAWTLANFYFRHSDPEHFWTWAALASTLTNDTRPLLRLANASTDDPLDLIHHLGNRPAILRPYLDLLIIESRFADAQSMADLLHQHNDPADAPRFAALEQRLRTIRSSGAR